MRYPRYHSALMQQLSRGDAGVGQSLSDAILALSPAGYWKLDETSGTTAADSSGNARDMTYGGTATLANQAGEDGASYATVAGAGSLASVGSNAAWAVNAASGLSVVALIRPSGNTLGGLIHKVACWEFVRTNNTALRASSLDGNAQIRSNSPSVNTTAGAWHLVMASFGPALSDAPSAIVVNGTDVSATPTGSGSGVGSFSSSLYLGAAYISATWRYFAGAMAHVAVIPGTLTAAGWADVIAAAQGEGWIA